MEYIDVVDINGIPTGEIVDRITAHSEGIRHRTAHIWVIRNQASGVQILLQKRSAEKESFPLCYDTSSAGHIHAGDAPADSAVRELFEELSIRADVSELQFIGTVHAQIREVFNGRLFIDDEIPFVFAYSRPVDIDALVLQAEEVDSVKWFDIDYILKEIENGNREFCVTENSLNLLKHYLDTNPRPFSAQFVN